MSAHIKCCCGRKRGDHSDLVVRARKHNRSAFNGYHRTVSEYSLVICTRKGCWGIWRTKADYVDGLPDEERGLHGSVR
jgi:hypothetical protein